MRQFWFGFCVCILAFSGPRYHKYIQRRIPIPFVLLRSAWNIRLACKLSVGTPHTLTGPHVIHKYIIKTVCDQRMNRRPYLHCVLTLSLLYCTLQGKTSWISAIMQPSLHFGLFFTLNTSVAPTVRINSVIRIKTARVSLRSWRSGCRS